MRVCSGHVQTCFWRVSYTGGTHSWREHAGCVQTCSDTVLYTGGMNTQHHASPATAPAGIGPQCSLEGAQATGAQTGAQTGSGFGQTGAQGLAHDPHAESQPVANAATPRTKAKLAPVRATFMNLDRIDLTSLKNVPGPLGLNPTAP